MSAQTRTRRRRVCPSALPRVPRAVRPRRARRASSPSPPSPRGGGGGDRLDASSSASSTAPSPRPPRRPSPTPPKGAGPRPPRFRTPPPPDELAAATLPVLPGEETAHWQAQLCIERGDASPRLARWLARALARASRVSRPRRTEGRRARSEIPQTRARRRAARRTARTKSRRRYRWYRCRNHRRPRRRRRDPALFLAPLPSHLDAACGAILARAIDHAPAHTLARRRPGGVGGARLRLASSADANHASPTRARRRRRLVAVLPGLADGTQDGDSDVADLLDDDDATPRAARTNARWLPGEHIDARVTRRRRWTDASLLWNPPRLDDPPSFSPRLFRVVHSARLTLGPNLGRKFRFARTVGDPGRSSRTNGARRGMADPRGGLAYSGKSRSRRRSRPRLPNSEIDLETHRPAVRLRAAQPVPPGGVACAYHTDPDSKVMGADSVIVPVGRRGDLRRESETKNATRRGFAFEAEIACGCSPTVTTRAEHCVYSAEGEANDAPRASIVLNARWRRGRRGGGATRRARARETNRKGKARARNGRERKGERPWSRRRWTRRWWTRRWARSRAVTSHLVGATTLFVSSIFSRLHSAHFFSSGARSVPNASRNAATSARPPPVRPRHRHRHRRVGRHRAVRPGPASAPRPTAMMAPAAV